MPSIQRGTPRSFIIHHQVSLRSYSNEMIPIWILARHGGWKGARSDCVCVCTGTKILNHRDRAKLWQFIFTVITGEGLVHISSTDALLVGVRKSSFLALCVRRLCAQWSAGGYMVSGLAAVKQWGDAEGGLLLSEGLRQTVTHHP